jgi:hypothetical protein
VISGLRVRLAAYRVQAFGFLAKSAAAPTEEYSFGVSQTGVPGLIHDSPTKIMLAFYAILAYIWSDVCLPSVAYIARFF